MSSPESPVIRADHATRFKKGQSGNPKGRPAEYAQFREECRKHSPAAMARLLSELEVDGSTGIDAAKTILAYAYGKPTQVVEANVNATLTLEQLVLASMKVDG